MAVSDFSLQFQSRSVVLFVHSVPGDRLITSVGRLDAGVNDSGRWKRGEGGVKEESGGGGQAGIVRTRKLDQTGTSH